MSRCSAETESAASYAQLYELLSRLMGVAHYRPKGILDSGYFYFHFHLHFRFQNYMYCITALQSAFRPYHDDVAQLGHRNTTDRIVVAPSGIVRHLRQ